MANSRVEDGEERVRRRRRSHRGLDERIIKSRGGDEVIVEPDLEDGRRIRVERRDGRTTTHYRTSDSLNMTSESQTTLKSSKASSSHRRQKEHRTTAEDREHRRRRRSTAKEDDFVYSAPTSKAPSQIIITETRTLARDEESSESGDEPENSPPVEVKPKKRKIKIVYMTEQEARAKGIRRASAHEKEAAESLRGGEESIRRSKSHKPRRKSVIEAPEPPSPPKRIHSVKEPPSAARSSLKRSNTTTSHAASQRTQDAPTIHSANTGQKRSTWGSFFAPPVQHHHSAPPVRLVECLTCLSDDVPHHKSAKLKCGHRMCHSCLKRIFKLSVVDPQHMPPKCCTSEIIPLKHVEKLFDINFKKKWNMKFQEYTTKNRIYCPARRCGEWIKPGNIHSEGGQKYGKCSRCKTKVCVRCNGKWHGSRECPKDEETNRLLETAKQAGWQRCYNCRTMVELKEGCNHMTCRCNAEFCMICGLKWKSCNCPWFNYDAVENDRLHHMRVAEDIQDPADQRQREGPNRLRRPRVVNYNDEINQRRRQERLDEDLARRLQTTALDDDDDYQGGIGDINGIGNNAGHFMNQDYVRAAHNILTGAFDQANATANYVMGVNRERGIPPRVRGLGERYPTEVRGPPPPPMLRRPSVREQSQPIRQVERVVPRRTTHDYATEAAIHAPAARSPPRQPPAGPAKREGPRLSALAGLSRSEKGNNRVSAWRSHIEPGVTPEEGVLSVVD